MLSRPAVKLLAVCAALVPVVALSSPAKETAESVRTLHLKARGGEAKLRGLTSVQVSLVTTEGDKVTTVTSVRTRPNRVRYDMQKDGVVSAKAFDGAQGWYAEGTAAPVKMDAQKSAKMAQGARFDDILLDPAAQGAKLALAGVEDVKGAPAWKLELTYKDGAETRFIDQKSGLEVKRVSQYTHEGKAHWKTAHFSDYRNMDGLMVNHLTEWEADTSKGTTVVKSVRYNAPVDEKLFAMPVNRS
ncbi:MAG: outer membrane lipoprotein-sorting protein [Myxococcaceae bacterium]|nr:outer membrane lipoprotein-sorting protein [Myxococcaceae bacterium]